TCLALFQLLAVASCGIDEEIPTASSPSSVDEAVAATKSSGENPTHSAENVTVYYTVIEDAITEVQRAAALRTVGVVHASRFHGARPAAATVPVDRLEEFSGLPWVRVIEVDSSPPIYPANNAIGSTPLSDRFYSSSLLSQTVPWGMADIGAPAAHGRQFRGAGVKVAVLDQAVHVTHPDLDIAGCGDNFGAGAACITEPASWNGTPFDHGTKAAGVIGAVDN